MKRFVVLMICTVSLSYGIGLEVTGQKPFDASGSWPAISMSITTNSKWPPVYFSSGVVLRPGQGIGTTYNIASVEIASVEEKRKTHSYYGFYGGTHVGLAPIFRPGVLVGLEWKKEEVLGNVDGQSFRKAYTKYEICPYFGLEVHVLILTFVVSNEGFGAGINFNFGEKR